MPNQRQQLTITQLESALQELTEKYYFRIEEKGRDSMASTDEIFSAVQRELDEYKDAKQRRLSDEEKVQQLMDIAVAAIFGIASIRSGGIDS